MKPRSVFFDGGFRFFGDEVVSTVKLRGSFGFVPSETD